MKRDLIKGIILISAIVLSSCSVNKLSSSKSSNDDVYFSNATAGEQPEYAVQQKPAYRQDAMSNITMMMTIITMMIMHHV
jgi:hypothetical protein